MNNDELLSQDTNGAWCLDRGTQEQRVSVIFTTVQNGLGELWDSQLSPEVLLFVYSTQVRIRLLYNDIDYMLAEGLIQPCRRTLH